jgi:hypothetical protein
VTFDTKLSLMLLAFSTLAAGQGTKTASTTMRLLVYNNTQGSDAILAQAQLEAGRILGVAGVRAVWLDCLHRPSAADPPAACSKVRDSADVVVRVLPGQAPDRFADTVLGIAIPPTLANVYYEHAAGVAKNENEVAVILGCAIAHEVGHLLLGSNSHSFAGIMHGEWGDKEFRLAAMGGLLFTSQQSKLIRVEARRRMILQTGHEQRLSTGDEQTTRH